MRLETNGDIVLGYRSVRNDLKVCNADKAGIREWARSAGLVDSGAR